MDSPPPPSTTSSSSSDSDHPRNSDRPFWCNSCSRAANLSQADAEHDDQLTCPFCNGRSLEPMIPVPSAFSLMFPLFMGILGLPAQLPTSLDSDPDSRDAADGEERVIHIDPINQTMVIHARNLDGLLEEINEMDLMKSSSSPASKESVEAMPLVKVGDDDCVCAICLESFGEETEAGKGFRLEAREMPCKHKYHGECILKWLEKQRTCPVCRFQMPAEKESSKAAPDVGEGGGGGGPERRNVRWSVMFSFPWLTGFFSAWGGADGGGDNATPR